MQCEFCQTWMKEGGLGAHRRSCLGGQEDAEQYRRALKGIAKQKKREKSAQYLPSYCSLYSLSPVPVRATEASTGCTR